MNELKAKCDQIEKRAAEQRQVEEKKHTEEIQFLKRTNQQLKVWYFYLLVCCFFCPSKYPASDNKRTVVFKVYSVICN